MYSVTFLKRISDPEGSAIVEAALVFPLVVLLIAGLTGLSLQVLDETKTDALRHRTEAIEALDPKILSTENIMRGVWVMHE
jgi:hypothetical protein